MISIVAATMPHLRVERLHAIPITRTGLGLRRFKLLPPEKLGINNSLALGHGIFLSLERLTRSKGTTQEKKNTYTHIHNTTSFGARAAALPRYTQTALSVPQDAPQAA